jgi:PIN domain nuclease of toxin-antitoxin system
LSGRLRAGSEDASSYSRDSVWKTHGGNYSAADARAPGPLDWFRGCDGAHCGRYPVSGERFWRLGRAEAVRLLLDTHIWLWSLLEPQRLSRKVIKELERETNELWLSPISIWEFLILCEKKRVLLKEDPALWALRMLQTTPMKEAPLTHEIAIAASGLALPQRDPADRFLLATAKILDLTFITSDEKLIACKAVPILAN